MLGVGEVQRGRPSFPMDSPRHLSGCGTHMLCCQAVSTAREDVENEFITWGLFWRELQEHCVRKEDAGACQSVYFTVHKK